MNIFEGILTLGIAIGSLFGPKQEVETIELTNDTPVAIEQTIEDTEMRQYFYEVYELVKDKSFIVTNEYYDPSLNINEEELYSLLGKYTQFDTSIIRDEGMDKYSVNNAYDYDRIIETNDNYYIEINICMTSCGGNRDGSMYIYNKETNELIYFDTEDSIYTLHKYGNEDQITGYYYNANKRYKEILNFDDKDNIHTIECEFVDHDRFNEKIEYILNEKYLDKEQEDRFIRNIYVNEFPYMTKEEAKKQREIKEQEEYEKRKAENAKKLEEQLKKQEENNNSDVWIDENGNIRYAPGRNNVTTNEPTDEYVYWTNGGKSYHSRKSCPSLARSYNIQEGTDCPKNDPCNNCCK